MIVLIALLIVAVFGLPRVLQSFWDWQTSRDWARHLRWKAQKAAEARKRLQTAVTQRLSAA